MRKSLLSSLSSFYSLALIGSVLTAHADNLTTIAVQGSGANWTAAIWKTNSPGMATNTAGASLAPVAGNTYETVFNGTLVGNGANSTRIRNPATAGIQTFPGAMLTMYTNSELRAKQSGAILNFPGVGGNPGLVLKGGMLNAGDDATFQLTGVVQVASQSYISHGANGGGGAVSVNRAYNFNGLLQGSGNLVIINSGTTVAQQVSGNSNTYSGQWIVQCGWLQASGIGSLGTNSITVDPSYTGYLTDMPNVTSPAGPAWFEPNYDLNSAGVLTLVNGGIMRLHQSCIFSAVVIEGTPLSSGLHSYAELAASFPANFAAGGSGTIRIQRFGAVPPAVNLQPVPEVLYTGKTARFTVTASGQTPLTFHWRKNTGNLTDGGNISGSATPSLVISNVSSADQGSYDLLVSNDAGSDTSRAVSLTVVNPSGEAYEAAVLADNPTAFYQFNETTDPATNNTYAFDFQGGFTASYGTVVQNGNPTYNIAGPGLATGFSGFAAGNKAAMFFNGSGPSQVTVPAWNLNTNTVTITAWINPSLAQLASSGIVFCRANGTVAGLNYSGNLDPLTGAYTLGYTWNNEWETYSWNSGITVPLGQWSLVALVVTPTNATIHLMNTNGLLAATHTYSHIVQGFNGTTLIGDDSIDGGNGSRVFSGSIDDVAVFGSALTKSQLLALYSAASGATHFAPAIGLQPASLNLYAGQTATFTVGASGSDPLSYQWRKGATGSGVYVNLSDSARISGSTTATLGISNVGDPDAADYIVIITNAYGAITSSIATLAVSPTSAAENITMAIQEAAPADWDTAGMWSDGLAATESAAAKPGSTYEVLPGARLRSPQNPRTAVFPGNVLKLDGDSVWFNNPAVTNTISEFRFKQPTPGTISFKKLVMNGGQLDAGNDGVAVITGEIDILTNAPFYNDSGNDRGYQIDAWLTGGPATSIEYHGYNQGGFIPTYTNTLNISGASNTFSGKWNVVLGTLLGTGLNALGTNDITVGVNGAFETTYDINNPKGNLFLNGRMYLHQNDTFRTVLLGGVPLAVGTYSFATLSTNYPSYFPSNWAPRVGAINYSSGSGSITVLVQPAPTIILQPQSLTAYPGQPVLFSVQAQGSLPLGYRWRKGTTFLTDTVNLTGSATSNLSILAVSTGDAGDYTAVVTNSVGSATSIVATLTVNPSGPPINITLDFGGTPIQQPAGNDWNTVSNWSDANPAAVSVYANPGSTYDIVVGARLRPPAGTNYAAFPGNVLKVEGSGVFENATLTAVGELRFKHPDPATAYFKKLVMNGGQLDNGDNGIIVIQGEIDILANTAIYVDTGAGVDRGYQIDAWLTGSGDILWHQWGATLAGPDLNITGTSNTFTGRWIVDQGTLLGSGPNSLGANDITVSASGALETLYNHSTSSGSLTLDGQMFLHQNVAFKNVTIAGTPLTPGTYTFAQLNSTYAANFPATWTQQNGSTANTGSGSLTVLGNTIPPVTLNFQSSGGSLTLTWSQGSLLEATDVTGPWTTNSTATSPFTVIPAGPRKFYRVQVQ